MSSHDLSLSSINKTAPVKTDTKTAAVEKTESEGFVEELKEVMGLKEKDDAKKTAVEEKGDVEKGEAAEKSKESESVETKEETTEEKVSQGSELLSRLEQANSTLVDEKDQTKKEKASQDSELFSRLEQSNSTLVNKKESSDDSESLTDAEVMLTQASIAAKGEKNSSKTVAEKTDPLKEIQWGSGAKSSTQVEGETQSKGEASGNKESTKELLTSTALIGKAEAEAGKLAEAKKAKIDISALGMTQIANGETVSLTEAKTTDSFAQQLATASGVTATQQATAAQKMDPAMAPLNIRQEQVSDEVAERINMMMAKNLKHVDIRLDPPEMGRMHIRLNMGADSAGVQFTVSNQQARDAIEQSLPRLREMFAQQGIQLADTSVQQQNSGESSQYAYQKEESSRQGSGFNEEFSEEQEINVQVSKPNDGISFYA
ncbi:MULTISPECIES: flagellar hook-length control protein FliK [Aliivibrio]|uniref:Flagellar hook-length control protein FliK n=1 Tax=Aliivibrio finisterrensis TaxID=511998 RepID=A0A4Q5KTN5_9GAMM|nr:MULTISPECIES: flagellar hook-length control protein FliK [Aliivibrio]MDD9180163.1 flagellar hook-length control protein FliK [Aliivibrio sp. A6]RYU48526.1 flagellar hook-length control protein FliK [Aliivibrio finisterrensis]RYU49494.1 flagellar hook-length control protein FliK [Aliivibrio finisterrensis]RYU49929.1 flagellar hook-length control protein FliK [Aliivibrio finisterrensis]RYU55685.1 flagellar hook-length control protein FliK [Aliivibrio finisterrensis]